MRKGRRDSQVRGVGNFETVEIGRGVYWCVEGLVRSVNRSKVKGLRVIRKLPRVGNGDRKRKSSSAVSAINCAAVLVDEYVVRRE